MKGLKIIQYNEEFFKKKVIYTDIDGNIGNVNTSV